MVKLIFFQGIILVTEDELKAGVDVAYRHGLVVEPAGAAALAALLSGKVSQACVFNMYTKNCCLTHWNIDSG